MNPRILIIDDDIELNELLCEFFESNNAVVEHAIKPSSGLKKLREFSPDLVVLDVMLPEMNGFEVLTKIREFSNVPVVMLTARGDVDDRIMGIQSGADDYLAKPFDALELWTRIQAILKRSKPTFGVSGIFKFEGMDIDCQMQIAKVDGVKLDLTTAEFEMLRIFCENPNKPLDRDFMMEQTRGIPWESLNRSVDVVISRLRQKLEADPKKPRFVKTIWGRGYMFVATPCLELQAA